MKDHEIILKMIEEADPSDTAKLDEIDEKTHRFLHGSIRPKIEHRFIVQYTRSRDALKAIRPEGWMIQLSHSWSINKFRFSMVKFGDTKHEKTINYMGYSSEWCHRTEELAELHAIIQAIAYERAQK